MTDSPDQRSMPPLFVADLVAAGSLEQMVDRFLDQASERFGSFAVGVYVHDHATGRPAITRVRGLGSYYVSAYERRGRDQDPVVQSALRDRTLRDSDSLMSRSEWRRLPVVREVFTPHAMERVLCAPFVVGNEVVGTLNLARGDHEPRFDDLDRDAARTAAAVLGIAVTAVNERVSLERESRQLRAALDQCRTPVVVTDLDAARRHANAPAAHLFDRIGVAGHELERLLDVEDDRAVRSWTAQDTDGSEVTVTVTSQRLASDSEVVVSVLSVRDDRPGRVLDAQVRDQLTAREAEIVRLALEGRRDSEIAGELYLSTHTVKHHIKAIYAKLGVHSRAELIALLLG